MSTTNAGVGLDSIAKPLRGSKTGDFGAEYMVKMIKEGEIDFDPDYQRGHVWSEDQQKSFIGYCLEGGVFPDIWLEELPITEELCKAGGPYYRCVDGKQRLTALVRWWNNEIPAVLSPENRSLEIWARDLCLEEMRNVKHYLLNVHVQFLVGYTRKQILRVYLRLNRGGTPHTDTEIARVQALYEES